MLSLAPGGVIFHIKLTPKAAHNKLDRVEVGTDGVSRLRACVTVVPEKGKANTALMKLLAKKLRLPKSSLRLIAGERNRHKTILIEGTPDETLEAVGAKLAALGLMG